MILKIIINLLRAAEAFNYRFYSFTLTMFLFILMSDIVGKGVV